MSSTTPSKMTTPVSETKNKTILIVVPVRTYYETKMDYDLFKQEYMEMNDTETETDYEKRCEATWERLLKISKRNGTKFTLDEIDEGECMDDHDALECYSEADDQWRQLVLKVAHEQEMDNIKLKSIGKYMALGMSYDEAHARATKTQKDCCALVDAQVAVATGAPKRLVVGFSPYGVPIYEGKPTY